MQRVTVASCAPGEFERQAALMVGVNELLPHAPQVMIDLIDALIDRIPLVAMVESEEQRRQLVTQLCDWGLPAHLLHYVFMPVQGMWVRDYGPGFARFTDGTVGILDAEYSVANRLNDDMVPTAIAMLLKLPVLHVPLAVEGGNILSNGRGLFITTTALLSVNERRGYDQRRVQDVLWDYYGFSQGAVLRNLAGERTGHADMIATFTAPDTVVLGAYDRHVDPVNADALDFNAQLLSGIKTASGPLKVVRIPMPPHHDGYYRTYTNVIYANGTLLVPSYPDVDPELERRAFAVYRQLLPDWEIIGIDCTGLLRGFGALRCLSVNIPHWLGDRFAAPPRQEQVGALVGAPA